MNTRYNDNKLHELLIRYFHKFWDTLKIWWICRPFARRFQCNANSKIWAPKNSSEKEISPLLNHQYKFGVPLAPADLLIVAVLKPANWLLYCLPMSALTYLSLSFVLPVSCKLTHCYCCFREKEEVRKWTTGEWDSGWQRCSTISSLLVVTYF